MNEECKLMPLTYVYPETSIRPTDLQLITKEVKLTERKQEIFSIKVINTASTYTQMLRSDPNQQLQSNLVGQT